MQFSTLLSIFSIAYAAAAPEVDASSLELAEEIAPSLSKRGYSFSSKWSYQWCSALIQKSICYSCGWRTLTCNDACCRCGATTKITCDSC